ncbi:MAG: NADH-quinone oxidoreductase subunit J, partial [Anaerolineales bacterium]
MLSLLQIAFLVAAFLTIVSAVMVVTSPSMVHTALWLILTLTGVSVFFILLNAGFLAVVQIAVYIDAIAIMIIIVVMLTMGSTRQRVRQVSKTWWGAAIAALLLFTGLIAVFLQTPSLAVIAPVLGMSQEAILEDLGTALVDVNRYIIPFEIASVLLLAAMIGSIMVA